MIESTGVSAVTIHGRTRYTRSSLPCNYDVIKTVKKHLTIPVILNGASLDVQLVLFISFESYSAGAWGQTP